MQLPQPLQTFRRRCRNSPCVLFSYFFENRALTCKFCVYRKAPMICFNLARLGLGYVSKGALKMCFAFSLFRFPAQENPDKSQQSALKKSQHARSLSLGFEWMEHPAALSHGCCGGRSAWFARLFCPHGRLSPKNPSQQRCFNKRLGSQLGDLGACFGGTLGDFPSGFPSPRPTGSTFFTEDEGDFVSFASFRT